MKFLIISAILAITLMGLSACSTIVEGRSQELAIITNPPNASCQMVREGIPIGTVNPTPGSLYVEKTKYDIFVTCKKAGYEDATYLNHSGAAGATVGNILLGGGIGWAVDSATGADNKYDTPINLTLSKQ